MQISAKTIIGIIIVLLVGLVVGYFVGKKAVENDLSASVYKAPAPASSYPVFPPTGAPTFYTYTYWCRSSSGSTAYIGSNEDHGQHWDMGYGIFCTREMPTAPKSTGSTMINKTGTAKQ